MKAPPSRRALLVTGMPGAGKSEFVAASAQAGLKVLGMGDAVRSAAAAAGVPESGIGEFADGERSKHGPTIWARRTLEAMGEGRFVVDGLRSEAELREFRTALGDRLLVVAIHASPGIRHRRLEARGRGDDAEGFARRDGRELGWGVGGVVALADIMIVNEGSLDELVALARQVAARILDPE